MNNEKFNGWTNRETWAASLHIDADEGFRAPLMGKTAQELEDYFHELRGESMALPGEHTLCAMFHDIGSLYRVNWNEIADALAEEAE